MGVSTYDVDNELSVERGAYLRGGGDYAEFYGRMLRCGAVVGASNHISTNL